MSVVWGSATSASARLRPRVDVAATSANSGGFKGSTQHPRSGRRQIRRLLPQLALDHVRKRRCFDRFWRAEIGGNCLQRVNAKDDHLMRRYQTADAISSIFREDFVRGVYRPYRIPPQTSP
jgi:hypothetical protein